MSSTKPLFEALASLSQGALFHRADLHIHSYGGSHDVSDTALTPEGIVAAAKAEHLSLIAVTDHNRISSVQATFDAARGSNVTVIPGVELSNPEGHLLCYFPDVQRLTTFFSRRRFADDGTPLSRCQDAMLVCLDDVVSQGGVAILAHIDGDGGIEAKVPGFPPSKSDILCHAGLLAVELKDPATAISYSKQDPQSERVRIGEQRKLSLRLAASQDLSRVVFSDAHRLAHVGRNSKDANRLTRLKMNSPSFEGLRLALAEGDSRIRLEDFIPTEVPHVAGLRIEGGFLDGQLIRFSKNLNCIVGGRGAGKSTAFEVIRGFSRRESRNKLVDSEVWPDLSELVWIDQAGERHTLIRRKGSEAEDLPPTPGVDAALFPIESYGQGETAQTSARAQDDPEALLDYLDQFTEITEERREEEELRQSLLDNQGKIEEASLKIGEIPQVESVLKITKGQLAAFERAKASEVVALQRQIEYERTLREELVEAVAALPSGTAQDGMKALKELCLRDSSSVKIGASQFKSVRDLAVSLESETQSLDSELSKRVAAFQKGASSQIEGWKVLERNSTALIDAKRKELADQGLRLDVALIKKLSADEARHEKALNALKAWKPYRDDLQKERRNLLGKYRTIRQKIALKRQMFAVKATAALEGSLQDLTVSVKFQSDALSPEAERLVQDTMGWKTNQVPRASVIVRELTVPKLLEAVRKDDTTGLCQLKAADGSKLFTPADAGEVLGRLRKAPTTFALERCLLHEFPRITVTKRIKSAGGKEVPVSRDFNKLSLGQQQSVLLALMLSSDSNDPLIIDQPEDNLDGEFIYHSLVPVLRRAKERRQVIIVTHNANIAVLADAELIFCLKSLRDRAVIVSRGSIDDKETRTQACEILEGSAEAFRRRARIYGIPEPEQ